MFGDIKTAIGGTFGIALLILGLALGLLAGGVAVRTYDAWFTIPDAERAAAERADARWKDAVAKAKADAELERQKAEDEIAAAERDLIAKTAEHASQMTALERSLEQEKAREPIPSPSGSPCGPAIPRGVRDALQHLGRAPAGPHSGKSDAALRPSG